MRIACIQFNPELGKPPENIAHVNDLLQAASPQDIDLLVLPELAFTGNHWHFTLSLYTYPSQNLRATFTDG